MIVSWLPLTRDHGVPVPSAATSLEFIQALYAAPRLNTTEIRLQVGWALPPVTR